MYPEHRGLMTAIIENDNIFQIAGYNAQQKTQIGVTISKYNELKELTEKYYNILVEKGIIVKEKTQQELLQEQIES